ncbi:M28 family peptidase [Mangrovimonas xylaniphaga]|uniref:M28 family peptidase n=1 Tax=Mangrovimonas xylaniphaga TaxID=1645915 RepID=UPI0006B54B38|nr:M28 family peptidase [Mangrovimonas xylaniphaga]
MKNLITLCCLALLICSCSSSKKNEHFNLTPTSTDPTVYANTITSAELKELLYTYASDEFQGRETGTEGQKKAVAFLAQQYQDMEVPSPMGDTYFQNVPLEIKGTSQTTISINGKTLTCFVDYAPLGTSSTQHIEAKDIVYVAYGIESEKYSSYNNLDVKDKIVLMKSGEPQNDDGTYITSGTEKPTIWTSGRGARNLKRDVAITKGAKAVIYMDSESFDRVANFYQKQATKSNHGTMAVQGDGINVPHFIINDMVGKEIYTNILTDNSSKTIETPLTIDITTESNNINSENVLAFIKGSEKPEEILVISSHLDHEGIKNGQIYNGADDDGSGTVALLEIAEAFKTAVKEGKGPKRSILFLHVTGEEKGLLGSKYYTDFNPVFPLENTIADLNIDMIGRVDDKHTDSPNYVYLIGADRLSTELHQISEATNEKYTKIDLDYTYNAENDPNRFYFRSDHYNFAKHNVPAIFYFNGSHTDYHKPTDTPDKIAYDLLETRTRLVFYTAWQLANQEQRIVADKAVQ